MNGPSGTSEAQQGGSVADGTACGDGSAVCAPQCERPRSSAPDDVGKPRNPHDLFGYTIGEEIANAITHGIGAALSIAGLVLLIVKAAADGAHAQAVVSAAVFGSTLIAEYLASTLYHAITAPAAKRVLRVIDHSCIYLLIAGSYTPFLLVTLASDGGIVMFAVIWLAALAGIVFEVAMRERQPRWLTTGIYLVMGWIIVFRLPQLLALLDSAAVALLVAGGISYTIGTAFYLMKRIPYMHSVFHLWVLAGSIFQFMAVVLFVI
ncbi:channel protein, hemolysin III family [Coriobacterium glomerans PW2]|uniref:Channel protein, hemolysin III family n=2 Tax=Coriobacterium TaxID=33870 RepID=F2NAB1_CORGP|nr:channel protein, hemolysin III family [Coriobacterium glomerans PW2]